MPLYVLYLEIGEMILEGDNLRVIGYGEEKEYFSDMRGKLLPLYILRDFLKCEICGGWYNAGS